MNWEQLLCSKRERSVTTRNTEDVRSEFRKDYHRIIGSASFRRLQDKATANLVPSFSKQHLRPLLQTYFLILPTDMHFVRSLS